MRITRPLAYIAVAATLALLGTAFPTVNARAQTIVAKPVATNLKVPAAFTFAPDGRIFYGELRTGRIRIYNPSTGSSNTFFTVPNLYPWRESGLLGVTLHPRYPSVPYVYAYATQLLSGTIWLRLLRLTDSGGTGVNPQTLLKVDTHSTYSQHKGGRLRFGPDGMLYLYIGYQQAPRYAQDLSVVFGKILRMTPAGRVPADNPFPGSLVWSYGHRNSFGMNFDPQTGRLWLTEGGPACNDELNLVVRAGNYGWGPKSEDYGKPCKSPPPPPLNTNQDGPNPILPKLWWEDTLTPTGAAFCNSCGLGSRYEGRLFMGNWKTQLNPFVPGKLRAITLNSTRNGVVGQEVVLTSREVVLSVERGPTGALYFSDESRIYRLSSG
jgi:glucose/arabinose dehydrogenase